MGDHVKSLFEVGLHLCAVHNIFLEFVWISYLPLHFYFGIYIVIQREYCLQHIYLSGLEMHLHGFYLHTQREEYQYCIRY